MKASSALFAVILFSSLAAFSADPVKDVRIGPIEIGLWRGKQRGWSVPSTVRPRTFLVDTTLSIEERLAHVDPATLPLLDAGSEEMGLVLRFLDGLHLLGHIDESEGSFNSALAHFHRADKWAIHLHPEVGLASSTNAREHLLIHREALEHGVGLESLSALIELGCRELGMHLPLTVLLPQLIASLNDAELLLDSAPPRGESLHVGDIHLCTLKCPRHLPIRDHAM
jgi:hypothetical protein